MCRRVYLLVFAILVIAAPASAASVSGLVTDATGAALPHTRIVLRDIAAGTEFVTETGADGRYRIDVAAAGTYLIVVTRPGFAESARTVTIADADQAIDVPVRLSIGAITADVSVTAARGERETREIPLHVETRSGEAVAQTNPLSTGDALAGAVNITPVGNGPFGVRPRLRGLDSTRLLVLVDGERLNTARQATDRTGAEVGLISPDTISRLEIVNGAGTVPEAAPLGDLIAPVIVEADGAIVPLQYNFSRAYQIGNICSSDLPGQITAWKREIFPQFIALCRGVYDRLLQPGATEFPFVNW